MEQSSVSLAPQPPLLIIPKHCTTLDTNYKVTDNVLLDVNISSKDTEGNETCVYNGLCNVKLIDNFEVDIQVSKFPDQQNPFEIDIDNDSVPIVINDVVHSSNEYAIRDSVYNQNQVWIDPSRSPYVCNYYDMESHDYAVNNVHHTQTNHITVEQHNTYITQNVFKYQDSFYCSPEKEFESINRRRQLNSADENKNSDLNVSTSYEDDEFACGVFLSQLQDEIINEKITKAREERKYIDMHSENEALNQLMSSGIQSISKQRKTILFLGHDSHYGQTIQKIAVNDPSLKCVGRDDGERESSDETFQNSRQKKYQCDKCKQIFDQITAFKQHMVGNHKGPNKVLEPQVISDVKFMCADCGKTLKTQKKFELHCQGHGDPDLECEKCHKVFASKFTLRTHKKIHERRFQCVYCSKTFVYSDQLTDHTQKVHHVYMCEVCGHVSSKSKDYATHMKSHEDTVEKEEYVSFLMDDGIVESEMLSGTSNPKNDELEDDSEKLADKAEPMSRNDIVESANDVIAKVMSNKVFLLHSKKARKNKKYTKICDVCQKKFDRVGDLKRHLIEHVIRSTLAKTPVSKHGTLDIQCEVCRQETFTKIDKYKAHLREHAKLTIYKCTFCDKCFSDSSNFSKHKKIHGHSFFQCDLCSRKFNSKKMIVQHMEYHSKHVPLNCVYCGKVFHFESKLNKHIKSSHTKEFTTKFRCRFCPDFFRSLKEKWDHEWKLHNVRSCVIDCMVCGCKFRKYTELKRHCIHYHGIEIQPASEILKKDKE